MHIRVSLYLTFLLSISCCLSAQTGKQKVLRHVVCFQFNNDVSEKSKAEAVQIFLDLKDEIPEIKKIEGGENISEGGLSKDFTHCFILTFESEAARNIYLPHPAHQRIVEKNKPLLSDLFVFDIWGEE